MCNGRAILYWVTKASYCISSWRYLYPKKPVMPPSTLVMFQYMHFSLSLLEKLKQSQFMITDSENRKIVPESNYHVKLDRFEA